MTENMSKKTVMLVFGTRPEAIKMAPLISELRKAGDLFNVVITVTGQHRQMLDQVLSLFRIKPDVDLAVMVEGQGLNQVASRILSGMEAVLLDIKPDLILVQGDTTSAAAAALAAFHHRVAIGHVEAGLRTKNKYNPFPEEMNRRLIGAMADLHFAPTERAKRHLIDEGVGAQSVYVTGNTAIDALQMIVRKDYEFEQEAMRRIPFGTKRIITLTTHRRESFGAPMMNTFEALKKIIAAHKDVEVVFPVHFNPNVRSAVQKAISGYERIHLVDPLDYEPFVHLMDQSYLILTDSGGIQEEAPSLGKPVLVLRETTERPEGVDAGVSRLVGTDVDRIVSQVDLLLSDRGEYEGMSCAANPYGDGKAAERIVRILSEQLR